MELVSNAKKLVTRLLFIMKHVYSSLVVDKSSQQFILHNKKVWGNWKNEKGESIILVDFCSIPETLISFSYFVSVLSKFHNASIKSFSAKPRLKKYSLHQVYKSFNTSEHIFTVLRREQKHRMQKMSQELIPTLKTKQDIFDLEVCGLWIGVDVYETYLRRFNKPTISLDDAKLFSLVEEGVGLVLFWQDYFQKNNVAAVVVSHDLYLNYNIVCKVAYAAKVPVYLPNARGLWYVQDPYSCHSFFKHYREIFSRLPAEEQSAGLAIAEEQIGRRLGGEVGVDMPYSTKSAYHKNYNEARVLKDTNNIKVLICSNCFYDNPHAYGGFLFLDFYEWISFLGRVAEQTNYDWYLKMHPDPVPGTVEDMKALLVKFPRIKFLPHETSHHQLIREGIDFVLTAYGSVGHEYPAFGIQVINAGYNPHVAYDFNWHPKSIEEYREMLLSLGNLGRKIDLPELYEFYYMHYYYVPAEDLIFESYRKYLLDLTSEQRSGAGVYTYFLDQLTDDKHKEIVNNMQEFIKSGKHFYFSKGPE